MKTIDRTQTVYIPNEHGGYDIRLAWFDQVKKEWTIDGQQPVPDNARWIDPRPKVCATCRFYHHKRDSKTSESGKTRMGFGECRRLSPHKGDYPDTRAWPRVFTVVDWCGEFKRGAHDYSDKG